MLRNIKLLYTLWDQFFLKAPFYLVISFKSLEAYTLWTNFILGWKLMKL